MLLLALHICILILSPILLGKKRSRSVRLDGDVNAQLDTFRLLVLKRWQYAQCHWKVKLHPQSQVSHRLGQDFLYQCPVFGSIRLTLKNCPC